MMAMIIKAILIVFMSLCWFYCGYYTGKIIEIKNQIIWLEQIQAKIERIERGDNE